MNTICDTLPSLNSGYFIGEWDGAISSEHLKPRRQQHGQQKIHSISLPFPCRYVVPTVQRTKTITVPFWLQNPNKLLQQLTSSSSSSLFSSIHSKNTSSTFSEDELGLSDTQKLSTPFHGGSGGGSSKDDTMMTQSKKLSSKLGGGFRRRRRRSKTTVINVSPGEFRQRVLEFTSGNIKDLPIQAEEEEGMICVEEDKEAVLRAPKFLERCIKYCSLLPLGYEFEQDKLIQLWIAQGLIEDRKNELMEDVGRRFFDYLCKRDCIVPYGLDNFSDQVTYKVDDDAMSSLIEKEALVAPVYLYHRTDDGKLADVSILCEHLSLTCKDIDYITFEALKKFRNLRTLLVLSDYGSSIKQIPRDVFLSLELLRTLDLSRTHISEFPSSVGNLSLLRFLDVSHTPIKRLPESITFLQTLRLRGCLSLTGLPKYMNKLTNLRHLDLDVVRQLMSMPTGMGFLTSLQTLRAFLVGREEGCQIGELKNLDNLRGSFCISRLENVMNKEGAKDAYLSSKQYIVRATMGGFSGFKG